MDRSLYIAMTGAKQTMQAQTKVANNLANAKTDGFKADLAQFRAMPIFGEGLPARAFAMSERPGYDFTPGAMISTGNEMDFAIQGEGWFAVQPVDGEEGYSRSGSLRVSATGTLEDSRGRMVMGEGGPINIPPFEKMSIGRDGTIAIRPQGAPPNVVEAVGRIRLVNPPNDALYKAEDGLFRQKDGQAAPLDANVRITDGMLEASNVNAIAELTDMIALSRQFELQVKMMEDARTNDRALEQLLQFS